MQDQRAEIAWKDGGVPVSARYDDPYYSITDGLAETRFVFLKGNGLPDRFRPGFHIAELGFGTGLTLLSALIAWRTSGVAGPLRFTSFEAYPMDVEDMEQALSAFPEAAAEAGPILKALGARQTQISLPDLEFTLVVGDARQTVPLWQGRADAWCLDGFSPAKNPELWEPDLMQAVADHTAPGGTFATYTAAGHVRRALAGGGFTVERVPGFGRKRHMTIGHLE